MVEPTKEKDKDVKAPPPNGTEKAVAQKPDAALMDWDPSSQDGWTIRDTGEERLYWHRDESMPDCLKKLKDEKQKEALHNTIRGFATDTYLYEDPERDEPRLFVVIQTTQPCVCIGRKDGEHPEPFIAPKGSLVFVGVTHAMIQAYERVRGSRYVLEMWLKAKEKVDIGRGQTVWRIAQADRPTKTVATVTLPPLPENQGDRPPF